jgi:hypothetical protein
LGREVETLLDEQILDRGLDGSLAFREKRLKVVRVNGSRSRMSNATGEMSWYRL